MIYLMTALMAEAKPLLEHWSFKRDKTFIGRFYRNDSMGLLVTGMGMENTSKTLETFTDHVSFGEDDTVINFGLCAAPETFELGAMVIADTLIHQDRSVTVSPLIDHHFTTIHLETFNAPVASRLEHAADMEAFSIYDTLHNQTGLTHFLFCKVVSDHFTPNEIELDHAVSLLRMNVKNLDALVTSIKGGIHV